MNVANQPLAPRRALTSDSGERYSVAYGYCSESVEIFDSFAEALSRYAELGRDPVALAWGGASITGVGADADCDSDGFYQCDDGLTEAQRDAIAQIDETQREQSTQ